MAYCATRIILIFTIHTCVLRIPLVNRQPRTASDSSLCSAKILARMPWLSAAAFLITIFCLQLQKFGIVKANWSKLSPKISNQYFLIAPLIQCLPLPVTRFPPLLSPYWQMINTISPYFYFGKHSIMCILEYSRWIEFSASQQNVKLVQEVRLHRAFGFDCIESPRTPFWLTTHPHTVSVLQQRF